MTSKNKRVLKKSMVGFEVELFTLNHQGYVISAADSLIRKVKSDNAMTIKKECTTNFVEIASYPNVNIHENMDHLLAEIEYLVSIAEENDTYLCPLGTYPGRFNPNMRKDKQYKIKESIFGKNRWKIAGRCTGFHCHYSLPRGIFDSQMRMLKMLINSKIQDSLVNSYNFLIAADPALTCLMQSSPFYQGNHIGKDSRLIMYRGGPSLGNKSGLYANLQEFGGLPKYKLTALDIMDIISTRYDLWKAHIKRLGLNIKVLSLYGSILDTTWNPVKINPNGTLEQRGMDMNHPIYIAGIGTLIKYMLKRLQEDFHEVIPSEIGIKEPFKVEGDKIYIPPYSYVRNELQRLSAYKGLESSIVHNYCKRFLRLAQSIMPKERVKLIEPFKKMVNSRKTVSDEILEYAYKKGFRKKTTLSDKLAAEIALAHSERLLKEIIATRKILA
jgi:hypothetical protein